MTRFYINQQVKVAVREGFERTGQFLVSRLVPIYRGASQCSSRHSTPYQDSKTCQKRAIESAMKGLLFFIILILATNISACSDQVDVIQEYKCNPSLPNQSESISQNKECQE